MGTQTEESPEALGPVSLAYAVLKRFCLQQGRQARTNSQRLCPNLYTRNVASMCLNPENKQAHALTSDIHIHTINKKYHSMGMVAHTYNPSRPEDWYKFKDR